MTTRPSERPRRAQLAPFAVAAALALTLVAALGGPGSAQATDGQGLPTGGSTVPSADDDADVAPREPATVQVPPAVPAALPSGAWTMQQIAGVAGQSHQASSFAMDTDSNGYGQAAVYGQPGDKDDSGVVTIYSQAPSNGVQWDASASLTYTDATGKGTDTWGSAVSLGGGFLAVGDQQYNKSTVLRNPEGQVNIFKQESSGAFTYQASLKTHGNHNFGASVAIAPDCDPSTHCWVVVGAPGVDLDAGTDPRDVDAFVAVYDLATLTPGQDLEWTDKWAGRDVGFGPASEVGSTVTIGGDWLFANSPSQIEVCAAWFNGTTWGWQGCQSAPGAAPNYLEYEHGTFGASMAFAAEADQLVVGFPDNSYQLCSTANCQEGGSWTKVPQPGEVVLIDVPDASYMASNCSSLEDRAVCFQNAPSSTIEPPTPIGSPPLPEGTRFGAAVAVDPTAQLAIIGMDQADVSPAYGTVYAYGTKQQAGTWELIGELPPGAYQADGAHYGNPLGMIRQDAKGRVAVGVAAPAQDNDLGYAYVWDLSGIANLGASIRQVQPPAPAKIAPGSPAVYEVTVTNPSPNAATDVELRVGNDVAPFQATSITLLDPSINPFWTCTTTCTATQLVGGTQQKLLVTVDTTGAVQGEQYPVEADVTWSNPSWGQATATHISTVDGDIDDPTDIAVTIGQEYDGQNRFVAAGQTAKYYVTAANTNGSVAAGLPRLVLESTFPGSTIAIESADLPWDCLSEVSPSGTPTLDCGGPTSLAPNQVATATIGVTLPTNPSPPPGSDLTTTAALRWDNPVGAEQSASATTATGIVLEVSDITASPDYLDLTWQNITVGTIDNLQLQVVPGTDPGFTPLEIFIWPDTACQPFGQVGVCQVGSLGSGDSVQSSLEIELDSSSDCTISFVYNAAWGTSTGFTPDTGWDDLGSQPVSEPVQGCGAGSIRAERLGDDPTPGGTATVRVRAANDGATPITEPSIRLSAAGPVTIRSVVDPTTGQPLAAADWSCTTSDGTATCTGPEVAPGAQRQIDVLIEVPSDAAVGAELTVTAELASGDRDPNPADNLVTVGLRVAGAGTGALPVTGSDPRWPVVSALALIVLGGVALAAGRARRGR